jgi:hypothetical protein
MSVMCAKPQKTKDIGAERRCERKRSSRSLRDEQNC